MPKENKITKFELEKRLIIINKLLLRGHLPNEIERIVNNQQGEYNWNLTSRQIYRYVSKCVKLWKKQREGDREKLLDEHLAKRNELYQLALTEKDIRAALAIQRDIAKLQILYDPSKDVTETTETMESMTITKQGIKLERIMKIFEKARQDDYVEEIGE